jgi:hypothetical protein
MIRAVVLFTMLAAWAGTAVAEPVPEPGPEPKPGLLKRGATVDKPIPETYEPLNSTYVEGGEKLNESIEQSWELKKKAREQQEQAAQPPAPTAERKALEERIEEPGAATQPAPLPTLESQEKSIRITEP